MVLVKEPPCQSRRHNRHAFEPWVKKIPWRRKWQPTPVFLPGESQGWGNLLGCHLWGRTESDTKAQPRGATPRPRSGGAAERRYQASEVRGRDERSYPTFKVRGGGLEEIPDPCLENLRVGGAWWAAIYGVTQSWTRLK